jgi:hypothetical protein
MDCTGTLDEVGRKGYSDTAYNNEPEGCDLWVQPFGSMWMNCSPLLAQR